MTDPQLPPPAPYGSVPPVPQAPADAPGAYQAPEAHPAPDYHHHVTAPQAPPGAYGAPVGGYAAPVSGGYQSPSPAPQKPATLGIVGFVLGVIAAVVTPILAGISGYQVGFGLPSVMQDIDRAANDLSFLSPVRDQVLLGEIGFWVGTLAGIAAIVLGIMAIVRRQGRGWGITALILGVIAPVIFFIVLTVTLGIGAGAGAASFYSS